MAQYAKSTLVYREIRAALEPWCKANGFRRLRGSEPAWIRPFSAAQNLSFSFRCSPWGGGAIGGNSFYGLVQATPSESSSVIADASSIRQSDVSLCLSQAELDALCEIQATINRRRPRTAEIEAWMREDSRVGQHTREMYSVSAKRYKCGDFVTCGYYSLEDVRALTVFLARHLPDTLVRFVEGCCAQPKPQPMPPIFERIYGKPK